MQATPVSGTIKAERSLAERSAFIVLLQAGISQRYGSVERRKKKRRNRPLLVFFAS